MRLQRGRDSSQGARVKPGNLIRACQGQGFVNDDEDAFCSTAQILKWPALILALQHTATTEHTNCVVRTTVSHKLY